MSGAWEAEPELGSFGRLWRVFMTARVAIAAVLVILQAFIYALGNITNGWSIGVCIAYLCATLAVRVWARPRPPGRTFDAQWVLTIGVDVITFSVLNFLQSSGINYTPLFALPVLLASILGPILLAFGTAASVTLLLLVEAWSSSLQQLGDPARVFAVGAERLRLLPGGLARQPPGPAPGAGRAIGKAQPVRCAHADPGQ
jgi:two-component system sensor histidine kinase PilS (NtrC family)